MNRFASLLLFLAVSLLTACGFHLRGEAFYDALPFESVYVALPDNSLFGNELIRNLRASTKTKVVDNVKDAQAILDVMSENKTKAFLSINVQGRAREYTLTYEVIFRLQNNKGVQLMPPTKIAASRTLIYNELVALGRESEEEMLYREMQSDLVMQVLRRLAAANKQKKPQNISVPSAKEPHAATP